MSLPLTTSKTLPPVSAQAFGQERGSAKPASYWLRMAEAKHFLGERFPPISQSRNNYGLCHAPGPESARNIIKTWDQPRIQSWR